MKWRAVAPVRGPVAAVLSRMAIVVALAFCAISCSTAAAPATWPNQWPCLNDTSVAPVLAELEKALDIINTPGAKTEPAQNLCEKRIYLRGKYRIVVFRAPGPVTVVEGTSYARIRGYATLNRPEVTPAAAAQCLTQAGQDLHRFGIEPDLLDSHHKENPELWNDPDAGPAHYLDCSGGRAWAYYASLTVMVHELTHELTSDQGKCLFLGYPPGRMCFSTPSTLPSASIAILKEFPTQNHKVLESLGKMQSLYLVDLSKVNKGPLFLFNELNAYTAESETRTAIVRHEGIGALYHDGERNTELLPLLSLWVARYLVEMKQRDPDFYSETLTAATDDGRNIRALLSRAELSYEAWIAELKKAGKREEESEHHLWQQYQKERKLVDD